MTAASDVDVIDDLVFALLEEAARKLCVPSWPAASPPPKSPDVPLIEARRDDDGVLGVYRFATVVAADAVPRPHFEVGVAEAPEGADVGDEIGVELPLHVVCAVALADIDAGALRDEIKEDLDASGLKDAVTARLTLLRGPPPSSPALSELRALVTRHGGDVVRWTMSVRATTDDDGQPEHPDRLVCCVVRDDVARLVIVDAVAGAAPKKKLLGAIGPQPAETSLWCFLEREGLSLLNGDNGAFVAEKDGASLRLPLDFVLIVNEPRSFGEVSVGGLWSRHRGDRLTAERNVSARLNVDPAALFLDVDDAARARMQSAARVFHKRIAARLLDDDVDAPLAGVALLRVIARACRGSVLEPRSNTELGVVDGEDGGFVVDVAGRSLRIVPADDALFVDVKGLWAPVAERGRLIDGDVEAFRGVCAAVADALAGSDADADLVFVDQTPDGGAAEREQTLSAWLRGLGEDDVTGWLPPDAVAAHAWQDLVDVLLDER